MLVVGVGGSSQAIYANAEAFWKTYAVANKVSLVYYGTDMPPFWR